MRIILAIVASIEEAIKSISAGLLTPERQRRRTLSRQELRQKLYYEIELPSKRDRQRVEEYRRQVRHRWSPSEAEDRAAVDAVLMQRQRQRDKEFNTRE